MRDFGEITREVHRRAAVRVQPAEDLEEERVPDAHGGIGSLRAGGPERQLAGVRRAQLTEGRRRRAAHPPEARVELPSRAYGIDHRAAKVLVRRGISQYPGGGMLAYARECRG